MTDHHSLTAQSAYLDLVRSLTLETASEITGTPFREVRGAKAYWYENIRIGTTVKKRYLGEDRPELAADIANHLALKTQSLSRAAQRSRLIRILRAEGFQPADRAISGILQAFARAGAFRLGATIVGTQAFRLYEGELGLRLAFDEVAQTDDLDIAQFERLSIALNDQVETTLPQTFRDFDFVPIPSVFSRSVWRWKQTNSNLIVEFLTPSFRPEEDIRELPALGVAAQSLHFLNYLIADPIKAAVLYRSGVLVQIPRPERYAIHKLIVADRRKGPDQLKSRKDRAQAALLIRALAEDRPHELREAYGEALDSGPRWGEHIGASLQRLPETAALLGGL